MEIFQGNELLISATK